IKYNYEGLIYFDTFPIREDPVKECEMNIAMYKKLEQTIYEYGVENIEYLINTKDSTEIQKFSYSLLK
ncbi:AP endonuclease, partial [Staphylococcus succinus]